MLWKLVKFRGLGSIKKSWLTLGGGWPQAKVSQMTNFSILTWSLRVTVSELRDPALASRQDVLPLVRVRGGMSRDRCEDMKFKDPSRPPNTNIQWPEQLRKATELQLTQIMKVDNKYCGDSLKIGGI